MQQIKILIADDDETILYAFEELFRKDGYNGIIARDGEEALYKIENELPDIIFLDISMPRFSGLEVLKEIKARNILIPVVIITGHGSMQTAVKAIQLGAFEYMTKPLDLQKIREVIKKAIFSSRTDTENFINEIQFNADILEKYELLGKSEQMQEIFKLIGSISTTPNTTSVLISGESGTGKELVARAIHNNSDNSSEPFVPINCTAFPETLLESELFGHEKGSFTGAFERKLGKFEIAECGTIFLDEIGNLSPNLQQKLLRVIQNREYSRVGGNEVIEVNARFIAATNIDIAEEVKNGTFREDLFYRLNVASVHLSPLRERKDDIFLLANYFLAKYTYRLKKQIKGFSTEALKLLSSYSYPGNVRELENLIERSVMLTKTDVIMKDAFLEILNPVQYKSFSIPIISPLFSEARDYIMDLFVKEFIKEKLTLFNGNVSKAAESSKMTRQYFIKLMKQNNIDPGQFRS